MVACWELLQAGWDGGKASVYRAPSPVSTTPTGLLGLDLASQLPLVHHLQEHLMLRKLQFNGWFFIWNIFKNEHKPYCGNSICTILKKSYIYLHLFCYTITFRSIHFLNTEMKLSLELQDYVKRKKMQFILQTFEVRLWSSYFEVRTTEQLSNYALFIGVREMIRAIQIYFSLSSDLPEYVYFHSWHHVQGYNRLLEEDC